MVGRQGARASISHEVVGQICVFFATAVVPCRALVVTCAVLGFAGGAIPPAFAAQASVPQMSASATPLPLTEMPDHPITARPHRAKAHLAALGTVTDSAPADYRLSPEISHWYDERHATLPLTDRPVYCHGYGCEFQTPITIDTADLAQLSRIFAGHSGSPAEERKAISVAVTWWERHASPLLGGPPREHGSDIAHAHHMGATDCIDEATNSTTILVVLERHGFLKHHIVARPVSRGMIVNAHSTAIIHEIGGEDWAVDMWMHNMGEAPDIMTEAKWLSQA